MIIALAGCHATPKAHAPKVVVYANLDQLVQRHPGWAGVALYNQMAQRLQTSFQQAQRGVNLPHSALNLAQANGINLPNGAFALPPAALAQQRTLLQTLEQEQVSRLQQRRAQARALQIRAQMRVWRRDARQQYEQSVAAIKARYSAAYLDVITQNSAKRLNLRLQEQALEQDIAGSSLIAPTGPRWDALRQELATVQQEITQLASARSGAVADLQQQRDAALAQAENVRVASVAQQRDQLTKRLVTADSAAVAAQKTLLAAQTEKVLDDERRLIAAAVPASGTLAALALPSPLRPMSPEVSVQSAETRLIAQRDRWVQNIYGDTQAAAEDAARQRGWIVTFGKKAPGEPDRTSALASILASGVWKS